MDRVRQKLLRFALALPEAYEDHPWDETVAKVRKKVFVFFGGTPKLMTVKLVESHGHALSVEGVEPTTWEDSSLAQLWGPRHQVYVVPKRDFALFSLGRFPDTVKARERAELREHRCSRTLLLLRGQEDRRRRERRLDQIGDAQRCDASQQWRSNQQLQMLTQQRQQLEAIHAFVVLDGVARVEVDQRRFVAHVSSS